MSSHRRKADLVSSRRECVFMTQSVNCEFIGLDRFDLVNLSDGGLNTIRNQTLPGAISDFRVLPQSGSALSAYLGGEEDIDAVPGERLGCTQQPTFAVRE